MQSSVVENLAINWSVFVDTERKLIEDAIKGGHHEHLSAIVQQLNPEKVEEIEKIQKQLRPRDFTFDSQVQKEFEVWVSQNGLTALTPEIEQEWQTKIDAEKASKLNQIGANQIEEIKVDTTGGDGFVKATTSNMLTDLKGLGEGSIVKLRNAGINTVEEFRSLTHDERKVLLGGVVASKFIDF